MLLIRSLGELSRCTLTCMLQRVSCIIIQTICFVRDMDVTLTSTWRSTAVAWNAKQLSQYGCGHDYVISRMCAHLKGRVGMGLPEAKIK